MQPNPEEKNRFNSTCGDQRRGTSGTTAIKKAKLAVFDRTESQKPQVQPKYIVPEDSQSSLQEFQEYQLVDSQEGQEGPQGLNPQFSSQEFENPQFVDSQFSSQEVQTPQFVASQRQEEYNYSQFNAHVSDPLANLIRSEIFQ